MSTSTFEGNSFSFNTSYQIYDTRLRPIQSQKPSTDGRTVSETAAAITV